MWNDGSWVTPPERQEKLQMRIVLIGTISLHVRSRNNVSLCDAVLYRKPGARTMFVVLQRAPAPTGRYGQHIVEVAKHGRQDGERQWRCNATASSIIVRSALETQAVATAGVVSVSAAGSGRMLTRFLVRLSHSNLTVPSIVAKRV